jgi:hypothetical protein
MKVQFRKSEVISYLEEKIHDGLANEDEEQLYEEYQWNNKLNKNNYTYKQLIDEMKKSYRGE